MMDSWLEWKNEMDTKRAARESLQPLAMSQEIEGEQGDHDGKGGKDDHAGRDRRGEKAEVEN